MSPFSPTIHSICPLVVHNLDARGSRWAAVGPGVAGRNGMVVDSTALAQELRRRRTGRPALLDSLVDTEQETWLPGDLRKVPTGLLVLAAMSMARASGRLSGA